MDIPDKFSCAIPARSASTRFPGKPFELINGVPMLERVYKNAKEAQMLDEVHVAAHGPEVAAFCKEHSIPYIAVDESCQNGSEAVADVMSKFDYPYIFELQGDQPLVFPEIIDEFLSKARDEVVRNQAIDIVQPYARITPEQRDDVDVVKVAVSHSGKFLTFSRKPLETGFRTLGLYLWKREPLLSFSTFEVSDYEKSETTHLIRFVMNDLLVQGVQIDDTDWVEVDRPEHIAQVEKVLEKRKLN